MPVLRIIGCRIMEDELAHVLYSDRNLRHLILIDSREIDGLARKLRSCNRPHLILARGAVQEQIKSIQESKSGGLLSKRIKSSGFLSGFPALSGRESDDKSQDTVVVNILRMALHADGNILREAVCESIRFMSSFSDGILLFYGLCGNSLADIEADLEGLSCTLYFLKDESCQKIDDCIAATLGGNKRYAETLEGHPGVGIYFTPMWASN